MCNVCSAYKYNKTWNDVITPDAIKQMRATKAGFKNWEEYEEKYPDKKRYTAEVHRLSETLQRNGELDHLLNADKPRGLNGTPGAYQRDHIIPIDEGWQKGYPPEQIAVVSLTFSNS